MIDMQTRRNQLQVLLLDAGADNRWAGLSGRLRNEGLGCVALPIADYTVSLIAPSGVGAAAVDARRLGEGQMEILGRIMERLVASDVPVVVLGGDGRLGPWRRGVVQEVGVVSEDTAVGMILAHVANRRAILADREAGRAVEAGLAEQLKMAGRVQRDFLPARLPDSERYRWGAVFRPAEWVSGDMYDVTRLDEHHIGFYLADAVGHSMPAALLTMFLKHGMRMRETVGNHYHIFEPAEVMSHLNVLMTEQGLSGCQFATACYCLLNTDTREIRFARAGHPYPVLIGADGQLRTLESRGPLLGVFKDSQYMQESVTLRQGDKLLLYSDGAEAIVGTTDDSGHFAFCPDFKDMCLRPVDEMLTSFDKAAECCDCPDEQKDDITAVCVAAL